ncbi:hypothetical protein [Sulfuricystis multivorans]|uniref:hypothetical protein n=1 Tax=Sulfuricystis multivorans TaxID=2211108 RepID=UPI000F83F273|nr:hypothetical protein [Sulfuricystis multivorans]
MFSNKEAALNKKVLRPETVIALENATFSTRAQALPGVVEVSYSIGEVPVSGENQDEDTIDVRRCMRISPDIEERMVVLDRGIIIAGGLAYDQDSSYLNPCEPGMANGNIYHASKWRGDADEQRSYYAALGLDGDGNKDFSCQVVTDRIVKRVMKRLSNDLSLLTRLMHRLRATGRPVSKASLENVIQFAIDQEGWKYALDYIADALYGVRFWNRLDSKLQDDLQPLADLISESEVEACWDEAFSAGEVGNPLAIPLDIYEHGGFAYSVSGTGMNCLWDTSRAAAVWVPDQDAIDNILSNVLSELGIGQVAWFGALGSETDPLHARFTLDGSTWVGEGKGWKWREALDQMVAASSKPIDRKALDSLMNAKAVEYCNGVLEEYNDWVNGNVYGVLCYVIDRSTGRIIEDEADESWGYLGIKHAKDELNEIMLAKVLKYSQTDH